MRTVLEYLATLAVCAFFAIFVVLFAFAGYDTLDVSDGPAEVTAPAKVLGVRVVSRVASGTAQLKSVSTLATVTNREVVTVSTNFTYRYNWTTNDPPVRSIVTNAVVKAVTNRVPTATATLVVTNSLGGSITCSGGVGTTFPTNTFVMPGEPIHYTGTAKGRVLVIIER